MSFEALLGLAPRVPGYGSTAQPGAATDRQPASRAVCRLSVALDAPRNFSYT
jgi:hypothetical protein